MKLRTVLALLVCTSATTVASAAAVSDDLLDVAANPFTLLTSADSALDAKTSSTSASAASGARDELARGAIHREMRAITRAVSIVSLANIRVPLLPDDYLLQGLATSEDVQPIFGDLLFSRSSAQPAAALRAAPLAPSLPSGASSPDITPEPSFAFVPQSSSSPMSRAQEVVAATPVAPLASVTIAAGSAATILGLVGFALYHRIRANATLENDTRKSIFEAVCSTPGLGVHTIAERASVSYSTATYHLERLVGAGMLVMTPDGNKLCYYKNGGAFTENERKILPILKNDEATKLLEAILNTPGTYRAALAERLGVTATTINWHLRRLREAGLVYENRQGRNAYLYANADGIRTSIAGLAAKLTETEGDVAERLNRYAALTGGSIGAGSA